MFAKVTLKSNILTHSHSAIFENILVPFVESPKYAPQRRDSSRTLAVPHPHPFLRANSDSSMNLPDWMAMPNAPTSNIVSVQVPAWDFWRSVRIISKELLLMWFHMWNCVLLCSASFAFPIKKLFLFQDFVTLELKQGLFYCLKITQLWPLTVSCFTLQGFKHTGALRSSSSPRGARTRSPSRGRIGDKEERSRQSRRQGWGAKNGKQKPCLKLTSKLEPLCHSCTFKTNLKSNPFQIRFFDFLCQNCRVTKTIMC